MFVIYIDKEKKKKKGLDLPGFEPWTFGVLSRRSTTLATSTSPSRRKTKVVYLLGEKELQTILYESCIDITKIFFFAKKTKLLLMYLVDSVKFIES